MANKMSLKPFLKKIRRSHLIIFLLVSFLVFLSYYLIFNNAILDETMLYSWAWILNYLDKTLFYILLVVIVVISYIIARIRFKLKEKHFLIFIFLLAFILSSATWNLASPNPDVAEFFGVAKYVELHGPIEYFKDFGTSELRGYRFHTLPFLLGLLFRYFGESYTLSNIILSTMFAFIPVLTFLLSRRLFDRKVASISAFFILSIPFLLIQSSMLLVDVSVVFFVLLSLLTFYTFLKSRNPWYYPLTIITFFLAIFSKRPAILFLLITLPLIFLFVKKREDINFKILSYKTFMLLYILFVVVFIFVFLKFDFFSQQLALDASQANIIGEPDSYENPLSFLFQIQPLIIILFLTSIMFLFVNRKLSLLFLTAWFVFPYIFLYETTLRYMMPAFPAIAIGAAYVLSRFKKPIITFTVTMIFLSSTLAFATGYLPLMKNEFYDTNILETARYVDGLEGVSSVGVYIFYEQLEYVESPKTEIYGYVFDHYSDKRVYYYVSESVNKVYNLGFSRFKIFDYYKDNNYWNPDYDAIVVFSDVVDFQDIVASDVDHIIPTLDEDYVLEKTYSLGKSGIEPNSYGFIYLRKDLH
mgnify:CR=1 FL=1